MPKFFTWLAAIVAVSLSVPFAAHAAEPFVTAKVVFRNPGPYAQADLETAAGVHVGDKLTLAGTKAAAQRLVETQAFDGVTMDSSGPANALTVIFILKPLPKTEMLPIGFENFVWLTPAEREVVVRRSAPLFHEGLPPGSSEIDALGAALQAALIAKGVKGAIVTHEELQPTVAQPMRVIEFRVEKPTIVVDRIELEQAGPLSSEVLKLAQQLQGTPYAEGYASDAIERTLLHPYLDAGYLQVQLVKTKLDLKPSTVDHVGVDIHARVEMGEVFHLGTLRFVGTSLVSQTVFETGMKLHTGDVVSRKLLLESLGTIYAAYQKQGFADAYVQTGVAFNEAAHIANYDLTVVPGEQYRLRELTVENLPSPARAQFDLAWSMKPGDLYNADYVQGFLSNNTALRGLAGYTGTFQAASDPQTHLVDLRVTFVPTGNGH